MRRLGVNMGYANVPGPRVVARCLRWGLPFGVSVVTLWLLAGQIDPADIRSIAATVQQVSSFQILGAVVLSALSFWAVGRYDVVAHRHFQTGVEAKSARNSGIAAVALAQTLGFGLLTGALVRWRMLPGLTMPMALRLSAFVCLSFLGALAFLLAVACLALPAPSGAALPAMTVLAAALLFLWVLFRSPVLRFGRMTFALPTLPAVAGIVLWAALDTVAAAGAFYLLLPNDGLGFGAFFPLFLIALGAALLSGAPGGVGPFELSLLALLPHVPAPDLLATILLYRAVYYALPAILALALCAFPQPRPFNRTQWRAPREADLQAAPRSEVGVIRQNGGALLQVAEATLATWPAGQTRVGLFDPLSGSVTPLLPALRQAARKENRLACLYKITARTAISARLAHWHVLRFAQEAVLSPMDFDLNIPSRRGLRRKLRQAEKSGITTCRATRLPLAAMTEIDAAWQEERGGARAGTMGCFCPDYIAAQNVFLAYRADDLLGFVSFHVSRQEWCLDLMRSTLNAPDGTMHVLVQQAIRAAAEARVPRLSLAAVPEVPALQRGLLGRIWRVLTKRHNAAGLRQFKASFAPRWQPLYAAAPSRTALWLSLLDIARAVHRPSLPANTHNEDEYNEVAPIIAS